MKIIREKGKFEIFGSDIGISFRRQILNFARN